MTPTEMMRECLGMDVSVRTTSGNTWQGLLAEVKGNGTIVLKPARELHYGKPEVLEKGLVATEVLWLRRNPKPATSSSAPRSVGPQHQSEGGQHISRR
ncbi:hypothetical protein PHYPSEUDO_003914 [Phytophthora pseudosyringae]|uniref:Uncharacterized protein n=1 Tax=Phytophthora pseudosyringae TaxID=221518 RepID=A0A8T1VUP9_9STRA|nr:hypothetical protein PHYPSEUDO_003914 [Phytophthora pseudosyringae]